MFRVGDRVRVNYEGADATDLRERGIETSFNGTIHEINGGFYRVLPDNGVTPWRDSEDDDPTWYVFKPELEPLAA